MNINYNPTAQSALHGIRVLDLSRLVAGNQLTHLLADQGAEVIKIETPGKGDALRQWKVKGVDIYWKVYARNKKSVSLNLRKEEGKTILLELVKTADVFVENYRVGGLEKMGLGPKILHEANPKLIIVRISGFGQTGPYKNRLGFGTLVEAMSGFAFKNGFPDRPPSLPPIAMADMIAGLYGAYGVMVALREVEQKGGKGQVIDLSLLEPIISILGPDAAYHSVTGQSLQRSGNSTPASSPRNTYKTKDNEWIAISGSMQEMAMRIFKAIGRADMCEDPRYNDPQERAKNGKEVDAILGDFIAQKTLKECMQFFEEKEVTAAPIYSAELLKQDPHVQERGVLVNVPDKDMEELPMHNIIPRLSETPGSIRTAAPKIGAHNREVLGVLGVNLEELKKNEII